MEQRKGSKFNYDSYSFRNDSGRPFVERLGKDNCKRGCVCGSFNETKSFECFKCHEKSHYCTRVQINRPQIHGFECMSCLARNMDLVYQPKVVHLETFFRTENIFERANIITFEFILKYEETKLPIDVRCFKGNKIELVWPMQGEFFLNDARSPIFTLKPLKSNSNRKNRKQDNFMIRPELLKEGVNTLVFKIPRLQRAKFMDSFQYEQTGVYFLGIYSVKQLSNEQVLTLTQRQRRHEKIATLGLFHQGDEQIPTEKQKIRLIDPYTCERIKFPVRGRYCRHVGTVCLITYISFQKRSRSWKCPICAVELGSLMNEPYLDVWIYEMLKEEGKGDSVVVYANGTYEWEGKEREVVGLDSDQQEEHEGGEKILSVQVDKQQTAKQTTSQQPELIIQQQPLVIALQNIDLESHPQPIVQALQQQGMDLNQYEYLIEDVSNDLLAEDGNIGFGGAGHIDEEGNIGEQNGELASEFQNEYQVQGRQRYTNLMEDENVFDKKQAIIAEVEVEKQQGNEFNRSQSNSDFEDPFDNTYIPPSKLRNITISPKPTQVEQSKPTTIPEIYSVPVEKVQKISIPKKQSVINQQLRKTIKDKIIDSQNLPKQSKLAIPNKNTLTQQSSKGYVSGERRDKVIGEKRLLERPAFIEQVQSVKKQKSSSLPNQRHEGGSSIKLLRKNIQLSQAKRLKSQAKIEYNPFNLGAIFPPPQKPLSKKVKNEYPIEQQKKLQPVKIKSLKCTPISYSKFVKHYCNIPIPSLVRKMNEDMKRLFKNILEVG